MKKSRHPRRKQDRKVILLSKAERQNDSYEDRTADKDQI